MNSNASKKAPQTPKNTPKDDPPNAPRHLKLRLEGRGGAPRSAGSIRRAPAPGVQNLAFQALSHPYIPLPAAVAITARLLPDS